MSAQNLESIGKKDQFSVSGGVSVNQIFYGINGIESRRDPYSLYAAGNVSLNFAGWSVPISFSYSNQEVTFQQPFNQYGIHPTYKWLTGHFGWSSTNFSSYTLAGHVFLGAAVDATPGKWNISAMYGRLLTAVEPDTLSENTPVPSFKRMGYGVKAGYADGNDQAHFILFRARDDENSIAYVPEEDNILPEENLVLSFIGSKQLFDRFVINAEYAISGITRDNRSDEISPSENRIFANVGNLFTPRLSTSYYNAIKSGLTYQGKLFSLGVGYERIDPGYRTLGAYFFNNDLVNYTINGATSLFSGKVSLAANVGLQRDNLDDTKISTLERTVGSVNIGYAASPKLNLAASYSNFTTFTNIRSQFLDINELTPFDNLDTLNFTQISQNATLNANYIIKSDTDKRQNLNMNFSFQNASDQQGGVEQNSGSRFYLANTAYSMSIVPKNMTLTASFNFNQNESVSITTTTIGPTVAVSKTLLEKKLRTSISSSWNSSFTNGEQVSRVFNVRANGGYSIKKKHNLNLSLVMVNRASESERGAQAFTEFTGTLGYSYNFSSRK